MPSILSITFNYHPFIKSDWFMRGL